MEIWNKSCLGNQKINIKFRSMLCTRLLFYIWPLINRHVLADLFVCSILSDNADTKNRNAVNDSALEDFGNI